MTAVAPFAGFLGVDVGTSAVKALLVDEEGGVRSEAVEGLDLISTEPLAAEQEAEQWWEASTRAIRSCLGAAPGAHVRGIGLTGQKHALLALDARDRPLARAVLWADGRAQAECDEVRAVFPAVGRRTGALPLPGFLVPKWLRFRRHHPDLAARTARLCYAKDYIRLRLSGEHATDRTEASASQVYDFRADSWSDTLLRVFDLDADRLPPVLGSVDGAGEVSASAQQQTGLARGTPIAAGAGDNEAAALGCSALGIGQVAVALGTSATVVAWSRVRGSAGGLSWCRHVLGSGYAATGTVLSAGRALEWIARVAFPRDATPARVVAEAERVPECGAPLLFLPSLVGERSPVPDPLATGAFVGLRPVHERGHLARAVMDGVALSVAEVLTLMRASGVEVRALRLTSGGAASLLWCRLIASAAGLPVLAVAARQGPALGAALLGRVAADPGVDLRDTAAAWQGGAEEILPDPAEATRLRALGVGLKSVRAALRGVHTHFASPLGSDSAGPDRGDGGSGE